MTGFARTLLTVAGIAITIQIAAAAPVAYSESVDGELANAPGAAWALDVGDNTISGTTHFAITDGPVHDDTDRDAFAFTVQAGRHVTGIALNFNTKSFNVVRANSGYTLCASAAMCQFQTAEYLGEQDADFFGNPTQSFSFGALGDWGPGSYSILQSVLGLRVASLQIPTAGWYVDYTWTLTVAELPEPGSLGLAGLALAALLPAARRQRGQNPPAHQRAPRLSFSTAASRTAAAFSRCTSVGFQRSS
jgi:hypothetical protein